MSKKSSSLPADYKTLLGDIKQRVRHAQTRAVLAVNAELIRLYWEIGALIDSRQKLFVSQAVAQTEHDKKVPQPNRILAEYALRDMEKPIGVSSFELTRALPETLKSSLPTIEEIEKELEGDNE